MRSVIILSLKAKKSNVQYSFIPGIYGAEKHAVTQASMSTAAAASLMLQLGGSESYCAAAQ